LITSFSTFPSLGAQAQGISGVKGSTNHKMAETKSSNLTKGHYKHGFYYDGFLPCSECPEKESCTVRGTFKDHRNKERCVEEKEFFESTLENIKTSFELDSKDLFQLPAMIMNMIKIKRINRYMAEKGPVQTTFMFNPKTGDEHEMDTSNVLSRDSFYAQRALLQFLDSLRLSRQSRDAKQGIDVLGKMMANKINGNGEE